MLALHFVPCPLPLSAGVPPETLSPCGRGWREAPGEGAALAWTPALPLPRSLTPNPSLSQWERGVIFRVYSRPFAVFPFLFAVRFIHLPLPRSFLPMLCQ
jgi:hypothetical protein